MILVEDALSLELSSETPTDTSLIPNISLLLKVCTLANTSTVEPKVYDNPLWFLSFKLPWPLVMFCPSIESPKVPLSATLKERSVTEVHTPDPQEPVPSSLVTPMITPRPESDYPLVPERPLLVELEPWSVWSLPVEELINPSWRPVTNSTSSRDKERSGLKLEVLPWTLLSILTEVVTINILVSPVPSADTPLQDKR